MKKIDVMLVEDHPEYRESVELVLGTTKEIVLAHQFGTADQCLHVLEHNTPDPLPDVILLDLNLPGLKGIDALPLIKQHCPESPIVVLTQSDCEADVLAAISAGASGYLLKASTGDQLIQGIRSALEGETPIDPKVARFILNTLRGKPKATDAEGALSERELEVLGLLGDGLAKKEIANQLEISTHTVDNYMRRIYEKFLVPNAAAAISKAYKIGLFPHK